MTCKEICLQYKAVKVSHSKRYENGQVRCQVCDIFMTYSGLFCPCCGTRVRTKPRNAKYKSLSYGTRPDSSINAIYVGSGIDPHLTPVISQEYLKLVPRVSIEKYDEMKTSMKKYKMREQATLNQKGVILDGYTRYQICSELSIPFKYDVKYFDDIIEEKNYVKTTNLERRQLTPYQMIEMKQDMRQIYQTETEKHRIEYLSKLKKGEIKSIPLKERLKNTTSYRLAKLLHLGPASIDKANYIFDNGTKEEKDLASSGIKSLEHVYKKVVNRRHADPNLTKRNSRVFPTCQKCGSETRFKGKCHVHDHYCCQKCSWGN